MRVIFDAILTFLVLLSSCSCSSDIITDDTLQNDITNNNNIRSNLACCYKLSVLFHRTNHGNDFSPLKVKEMLTKGSPIQFEFPRLQGFGMEQALALATSTRIKDDITRTQRKVMCLLVLIVYRLLQFHIKRLFHLPTYEYSIPRTARYAGIPWNAIRRNGSLPCGM